MKFAEGRDEHHLFLDSHCRTQRLPENGPTVNQHSKGTLDVYSHRGMKVIVVILIATAHIAVRSNHRIDVDVRVVTKERQSGARRPLFIMSLPTGERM